MNYLTFSDSKRFQLFEFQNTKEISQNGFRRTRASRSGHRRQPDEADDLLQGEWTRPPRLQLHLHLHHQRGVASSSRHQFPCYNSGDYYSVFFEQLLTVVLHSCCPCCVGHKGGEDVGCWPQVMCCCSVLQWRSCLPGGQGDQEHGGESRGARRHRRGAARPPHGQALRGARGAPQRSLRQGQLVRKNN